MALGSIFGGLWDHVGTQVATKLAPKSKKWRYQEDVKKWVVKKSRGPRRTRERIESGVGGSPYPCGDPGFVIPYGTLKSIMNTPLVPQGHGGGIVLSMVTLNVTMRQWNISSVITYQKTIGTLSVANCLDILGSAQALDFVVISSTSAVPNFSAQVPMHFWSEQWSES